MNNNIDDQLQHREHGDGFKYPRRGRSARGNVALPTRRGMRDRVRAPYSIRRSDPADSVQLADPLDAVGIAVHRNPYEPLYHSEGYDWHDTHYGSY